MKSKSDENKACGNQELDVTENSRKEDDELTWHNVKLKCMAQCTMYITLPRRRWTK